jgi:hypothetical protein
MDKIKNNNLDKEKFLEAFQEPFNHLDTNKEMYRPLFTEIFKHQEIDLRKISIPKGIVRVYWYQEGQNDEEEWIFIAKIKYGNKFKYIYYEAWCDYTGFDCQGGMYFQVSNSLKTLIKYAVPKKILN